MRRIRSTVNSWRSAQAGRVGGLVGSGWFFAMADIAGSRRKQRISKRRLVRCSRIMVSRVCRYAPCSLWRNTCGQGFPPQQKGLMEHRASQLILPFEPALSDRPLILAPRMWPTMTPRARQQLAKRLAHLLRSVLIAADARALSGGLQNEHAAQFGKSSNDGSSGQAGLHLRAAVDFRPSPPAPGEHGAAVSARRPSSCVWLAQGTD